MKKLLIVSALLAFASAAHADRWGATNALAATGWAIDDTSLSVNGDRRVFWALTTSIEPSMAQGKSVEYRLTKFDIDCNHNKIRTISEASYDLQGQNIQTNDAGALQVDTDIPPESSASLMEFITCYRDYRGFLNIADNAAGAAKILRYTLAENARRGSVGPLVFSPSKENQAASASENAPPGDAGSAPIEVRGGVFYVKATLNDAVSLQCVLDSGASDVTVPYDVVSTLIRSGTVKPEDIIDETSYKLADGSTTKEIRFLLRSVKVGGITAHNVIASTTNSKGEVLLGQAFLRKLKSWSIDNTGGQLLLVPAT